MVGWSIPGVCGALRRSRGARHGRERRCRSRRGGCWIMLVQNGPCERGLSQGLLHVDEKVNRRAPPCRIRRRVGGEAQWT
ncbi:unnamed protein product [Ectocarpus sp. 4 AP-2014]